MKYSHIDLSATGLNLLPGEPWFLIRAKDVNSIDTIQHYFDLTSVNGSEIIKRFEDWQRENPDKLKIAD